MRRTKATETNELVPVKPVSMLVIGGKRERFVPQSIRDAFPGMESFRALATEDMLNNCPIIMSKDTTGKTSIVPIFGEGFTREELVSLAMKTAKRQSEEAKEANRRALLDSPEGAAVVLKCETRFVVSSLLDVARHTAESKEENEGLAMVEGFTKAIIGAFGESVDVSRYGKDTAIANMSEVRAAIKASPKPVSDKPKKTVAERCEARYAAILRLREEIRAEVEAVRSHGGDTIALMLSPRMANKLSALQAKERRAFLTISQEEDF